MICLCASIFISDSMVAQFLHCY